jgi:hypothetical protein
MFCVHVCVYALSKFQGSEKRRQVAEYSMLQATVLQDTRSKYLKMSDIKR